MSKPVRTRRHPIFLASLHYRMGYDAGYNGANTENCHFSLFSKPEHTKMWERGNNDGSYDREVDHATRQA